MRRSIAILLLVLPAMLLTGSTLATAAPVPEGKTYFVAIMGLNGDPYEPQVDCLTFGATEACSADGQVCLTWERAEGGVQTNQQFGFSMEAQINDDGLVIDLDGQGRVDGRGKGSAISLSARAAALDIQVNFVVAGRQIRKRACLRKVDEFYEEQAAAR